jgi:hypothetical protein
MQYPWGVEKTRVRVLSNNISRSIIEGKNLLNLQINPRDLLIASSMIFNAMTKIRDLSNGEGVYYEQALGEIMDQHTLKILIHFSFQIRCI